MSMAVRIYILRPFLCFSTVSRAIVCPGCKTLKSFGFLNTFWRLAFLDFAKVRYFLGTNSQASQVFDYSFDSGGARHLSLRVLQKSNSNGCSFSAPRLGCSSLSLSLLISSRILQSQDRLRLFLGVRFLGLRASGLPPPCLKARFQLNRVRRNIPKASTVDSMPCFSQWTSTFILFLLFR